MARRVCPCVLFGCRSRRTTSRFEEARFPLATGRVDGNPALADSARSHEGVQRRRQPAPRWPSRGAGEGPSRALERALRGKGLRQTEGIPGRSSVRSFTRTGRGRSRRPLRNSWTRERHGERGGGDRDVRGSVRTHRDGKKTPATMTVRGEPRATRRSELHCRRNRQSIPRLRKTRKRPDVPGTDEARVLVRRRENGRSRSDASRVTGYGKPQGEPATGRWPRRIPSLVLTHAAATPRWERCASLAALSNHGSKRDEEASESWWIATRRKASRSLHCRTARHGRVAVSVARVNARRASQDVRPASFPPVLEPARRCPRWRRRTSEIGDDWGEGCSSRWGAGGPSLEAPRGAGPRTARTRAWRWSESEAAVEGASNGSIEAGRCE